MKSLIFSPFVMKRYVLIISITCGLMGFGECYAQTIVGKWKRSGTTFFVKDKATGKQVPASAAAQQQYDEAQAARGYNEVLEINSDNTYTSTVVTNGGGKPLIHNGNYRMSGNELDLKIPEVNHQKTLITIHSITTGKMVWDMLFMGKLMEVSYTRM